MGQYFDFVKVLDFGLVKSSGPGAEVEVGLAAPNMVTVTRGYGGKRVWSPSRPSPYKGRA